MAAAKKRAPAKAAAAKAAAPKPPSEPTAPPDAPEAGEPTTTAATKLSTLVGIIAATVLAVLANVLVARHYKRWDFTSSGLYTLSPATVQTLHTLEEPVQVHLLLPSSDPLSISLEHLLDAYRAESSRVEVKATDPDRHPAEFLAIQQRYGLTAAEAKDGRVVADAAVIVVRGDKPYFVSQRDLVEVEDGEDTRARPRLEQALTTAIRSVLVKERPRACFTVGHGEGSLDEGGASLAPLRDVLTKDNYDVAEIPSLRQDSAAAATLAGCRVLVIAGPSERVPPEDAAAIRAYFEGGGSVLVAAGPVPDGDAQRLVRLGLDDVLGAAGLRLRDDFVFETDPAHRAAQGFGETILPIPAPHAITEGLLHAAERGMPIGLTVASSLVPTGASVAAPAPLLTTSDKAFGMVDFFAWAKSPTAPTRSEQDHKGPLWVAAATELPKKAGSDAPHGPRLVAIGSASALFGPTFRNDELRGTRLFVESAISWLAARPAIVDIPSKPSVPAGLRLDESSLAAIFRYVVVFIPAAAMLLGVAVHLRRRDTERKSAERAPRAP
jgi:hypothetical protein